MSLGNFLYARHRKTRSFRVGARGSNSSSSSSSSGNSSSSNTSSSRSKLFPLNKHYPPALHLWCCCCSSCLCCSCFLFMLLLLLLLLLLFRFVLVRENIPSFMPPLLPERLLLAGKSVLYSQ